MTLDPGQEGVPTAADHTRPVQAYGKLWCPACDEPFPCEDNRNAATLIASTLGVETRDGA